MQQDHIVYITFKLINAISDCPGTIFLGKRVVKSRGYFVNRMLIAAFVHRTLAPT